jgi:hypothetical protein
MPTLYTDLPSSSGPVYLEDEIQADIWTGQQQARVQWYCSYAQKDLFAQKVFGNFETVSYSGGAMVRRVPLQHPRYPALIARHLTQKMYSGFDVTAAAANAFDAYETVLNIVTFEIPPYQMGGWNPYMAVSKSTSFNPITVPNQSLRYASDGYPVQQDMSYSVPLHMLSVMIHQMQVPSPPGLVAAATAPLNSEVFYTPFGNYPVGTVQYLSDDQHGQIFQGGLTTYSMAVKFKVRPGMRWDYRLREDGSGADRVVLPDGVTGFIPMSDLNLIFKF